MNESILETVRAMIGPAADYEAYDTDLIVHINTYLGVLNQLGIGVKGFYIEDNSATWSDFLGEQENRAGVTLNEVKSYIYLRVRLAFDTPASSTLTAEYNKQIDELGWRLNTKIETGLYGSAS